MGKLHNIMADYALKAQRSDIIQQGIPVYWNGKFAPLLYPTYRFTDATGLTQKEINRLSKNLKLSDIINNRKIKFTSKVRYDSPRLKEVLPKLNEAASLEDKIKAYRTAISKYASKEEAALFGPSGQDLRYTMGDLDKYVHTKSTTARDILKEKLKLVAKNNKGKLIAGAGGIGAAGVGGAALLSNGRYPVPAAGVGGAGSDKKNESSILDNAALQYGAGAAGGAGAAALLAKILGASKGGILAAAVGGGLLGAGGVGAYRNWDKITG